MPANYQRFYGAIRGASAEALEALAPHAGRILSMWRREVHTLGLEPDDLSARTEYSFVQLAGELRQSQYPVFERQLPNRLPPG